MRASFTEWGRIRSRARCPGSVFQFMFLCRLLLHEFFWHTRMILAGLVLDRRCHEVFRRLRRSGLAYVPGYYSEAEVEAIEKACNLALREAEGRPDGDGIQRLPGSIRLKQLNNKFPVIQRLFARDLFLLLVGSVMHGRPHWGPNAIYQITHDGSLNEPAVPGKANFNFGGGHHFDQWCHQFKAFILLSPVTVENGPLVFLPGSNKILWPGWSKYVFKFESEYGKAPSDYGAGYLDQESLEAITERFPPRCATGNRGDLFLLDTRAAHYASPLKSGARRVLWLYF